MLCAIPVTNIPGVGQAKQRCLAQLGLTTVNDILHYFPIRYEDRRIRPIDGCTTTAQVTVQAMVEGIPSVKWTGRKSLMKVRIRADERQVLTAIWFNQHYLRERLTEGRILVLTGKLDPQKRTLVVSNTEFRMGHPSGSDYVPVYGATKGISSAQIGNIIDKALEQYGDRLVELLPRNLVQKYRLVSHREAVTWMHRARTDEERHQAHRRLVFEEFFLFQLQLQAFRAERRHQVLRTALLVPANALQVFTKGLPYPLTGAQMKACEEIEHDLAGVQPMVRLLQGDVGSGKTWVALWAAFAVWKAGTQTALMAPTEILAEQHFAEAQRYLVPFGMRVAWLTGSTPQKERGTLTCKIAAGEVDLVIGTHALLTGDVQFANLNLVITDEQHRFGVAERTTLRDKGDNVHVLMMSATPIPRTLALAVYGDLDVSVLGELPAGRKPIRTVVSRLADEPRVVRFVRKVLSAGQQAYVVAPLIDDTEDTSDLLSAVELEKKLKQEFAGFRVGLLHGRMNVRDKDQVMREFAAGSISVLVSTTVIEVGINVPNATIMMVYHAERFGLAQLHQLRGRVGRGSHESTCVLFSDGAGEIAKRRLQTLAESQDGFFIAEQDLELRGPGEFLGVRQSGLPEFSVGDIMRDLKIMEVARDEAVQLVAMTDFWILPQYAGLRDALSSDTAGAVHS